MSIKPINYKEYPECMFAMIAAYLPIDDAEVLVPATGKVVFRHTNREGSTYKNGLLHSYDDKPAIFCKISRQKIWFKDGKRHRDCDLPAIESPSLLAWYKNGKRHRERDLPAKIWLNISKIPRILGPVSEEWYINGKRHREGNMPAVIDYYLNLQEYWINGKYLCSETL